MSPQVYLPLLRLAITALLFSVMSRASAQDFEEQLSAVLRATPGKQRSRELVVLSSQQRAQGHHREAVEFATQAATEAERHGLDKEYTQALLELAEAHRSRGNLDHAIGAALRATMVQGSFHSEIRTQALLRLAEFYLEAGHPQKALEHLEDASNSTGAARMQSGPQLVLEARAKAMILEPGVLVEHLMTIKPEVMRRADRGHQLAFLSLLATAQTNKGDHLQALHTEEEVLKQAVALDRPRDAAIAANNLGALNHLLGRGEEAVNAYNRGLIMVEDLPDVMVRMRMNAAVAMARAGSHDLAFRQLNDARKELERNRLNMPGMLARLHRTQAAVYSHRGDMVDAQEAARTALLVAEREQDLAEQAAAADMLGTILMKRDLADEAAGMHRKARELEGKLLKRVEASKTDQEAQLLRLQRIEREQVDLLNREQRKETKLKQLAMDAENREKQMALLVYEKQLEEAGRREAHLAHDSKSRELQLIHAKLEAERQERMIQELDNGRMIQSLNVTRLELEQKEQQRAMELLTERNALAEAQQQRERIVKRLSIAMAVLAGFAALWMTWAWIVTRRKKRTIWEQHQEIKNINVELANKNNDIQSSISYARSIQSAILPREEDLRELMAESFMLYKPLDVVSGDLPYVRRVGDRLFVAAIDCTGHGVPAAMMTFIAYYGLNELLQRHAHEETGRILDLLHDHVRKTMDARGEKGIYNDGFDIGLCALDLKNGSLCFAGAQLPLLLMRNGEVERVKGDVLPLGDEHFARKEGYRTHQRDLRQGDSIFLLSDGLIHQFGGENGKRKFSMKRLTELLQEHAHLDLASIKAHTNQAFDHWKQHAEQTDDILLIGMRYAA